MNLQFMRQADLALSSNFFSKKITEVNSRENKIMTPNQNLEKYALTLLREGEI